MEEIEGIKTKNLDHLGIVSGICEEIGLVSLIDSQTNSDEQRKVSIGTATKAMILNGLGFANRTLYLTPDFFADKPVDILLGADIKAEDLNSHSLGTALDALYYGGISEIFHTVSLQAIRTYGIEIKSRHLDGTSFMVHGDSYKEGGEMIGQIELKRGYNKQKRHDLLQFVLEMISANVEGIPLFIKAVSGNKTDKTEFPEVLEAYMYQLEKNKENLWGHVVADSALYSEQTLKRIDDILWISRVPETLKAAKGVLKEGKDRKWQEFEGIKGYKYEEIEKTYGGVAQRWLVIWSAAAAKRSEKTVNKWVVKEKQLLEKASKKLTKPVYATKELVEQSVQTWYDKDLKKSEKRYHNLGELKILEIPRYGRGRRQADAKPKKIEYCLESIDFQQDKESIKNIKVQKSQFILATNDLDLANLPAEDWLHLYKNEQQKVERGFRFLKDPMFLLDHVYLELPRRIMALSMVMALCLLIYTLAQYKIRKALKEENKTVPNQLKKPIQNPTMRWIFQLLNGIHVMYVDGVKKYILNLDEIKIRILKLMGATTQSYYTV